MSVLAVDWIERPIVAEHRTLHGAEERRPFGGRVGDQPRDRFAMLGHDVFDAGLAHTVHQLEAGRFERGRRYLRLSAGHGGYAFQAALRPTLLHDHNIMTIYAGRQFWGNDRGCIRTRTVRQDA